MSSTAINELLQLEDVAFLKAVVARYLETNMLAGKAEASPEGNPTLKDTALAYKVFDADEVDPTAVEADRTFLGLLLFKAAYNGDKSKFPNLDEQNFQALQEFTHRIAKTDADVEFVLYSLACNDLGKTQHLVDEAVALTGHKADDHDQLLAEVVGKNPTIFPGMQGLSPEQQAMYSEGLNANLNLGQFVQGENLPINLVGMQNISQNARDLRLLAELYDFAGVTGHVNPNVSMVMNNDNFYAFTTAIDELMKEPRDQSYQRYIADRAAKVGIIESADPAHFAENAEAFAKGRIAAMSRAFKPEEGEAIQHVWDKLPKPTRDILTQELNETGFGQRAGVLVYYAPAVIANSVKTSGDFETGLEYALKGIAGEYKEARRTQRSNEGGVITVNVSEMAKQALKDPQAIAGGGNFRG